MTIDRAVMIFAGCMNLLGLALGLFVDSWWFLLSAFVGLNLIQAPLTGFCLPAKLFKKLGVQPGGVFYTLD